MTSYIILCGYILMVTNIYSSTAAKGIDCSDLECSTPCQYGFQKDTRGCLTCECREAECQDFQCEEKKICKVFNDTRTTSRMAKCVDPTLPKRCQAPMDMGPCRARKLAWFYDSDSDSCQEFTYGGCRGNLNRFNAHDLCEYLCEKRCSPISCYMHCEYGFEEGDDGCQICKCKKPTKDNDGGKRQPAVFEILPGCDTDDETECDLNCPHGYKKDKEGCHICKCLPPLHCDADFQCDLTCEHGLRDDVNSCPKCECRKEGECSKIDCYMYCPYGRKLDRNGCRRCECRDDPCDLIDCGEGQQCRGINGTGQCISLVPQWLDGCPSIMCAMYCEYGFLSDVYGCNICKCKTSPSPECPLRKCSACEPDFGYEFTEFGCQTCTCHVDPCFGHSCDDKDTDICVAEKQCKSCAVRPLCVRKSKVRRVNIHLKLLYPQLPQNFETETFLIDIKEQLSDLLKIKEENIALLKVSQQSDDGINVDFHLLDDNEDPVELYEAVNTLQQGAPTFQHGQTAFSCDPKANSASYYTYVGEGAGNIGESKQGPTAYIIIGCVVGGLALLIIGIVIALVVTKRNKTSSRPARRKDNVIYRPTTYEDNA